MRVALDSNVIIYAEGGNDDHRRDLAHRLIGGLLPSRVIVPLQAAAESLRWLINKAGFERSLASQRIAWWLDKFSTQPTTRAVFSGASEIVVQHRIAPFDAVILAAAAEGGASVLLTEDMQDGFRWNGVTVANPFAPNPSPIIRQLINSQGAAP